MSDDEYYDDEYADFHDMLYDADPDPDLADDLAEHAAHSPVYMDNPNEEARDYFSDWEYYSDDYFDDDPVLVGAISNDQPDTRHASRNNQQPNKRGRKRKLSEVRDRLPSDTKEMKALSACIQGTVWKTQSPELEKLYRGEHPQPVALRLSKAIMKSAYSMKKGFGTGRTAKDESWANDLSLADMGLRTETSIDLQNGGSTVTGEVVEDDEQSIGEDVDMGQETDEDDTRIPSSPGHLDLPKPKLPKTTPTIQTQMNGISLEASDNDRETNRVKRRKLVASGSSTEHKNPFITPETSLDPDFSDAAMDMDPRAEPIPPKHPRGRPKKQPEGTVQNTAAASSQKIDSDDASHRRQTSRNGSTVTASTASSRAKKDASSSTTSILAKNTKAGVSKITKTTRKTRSQQK